MYYGIASILTPIIHFRNSGFRELTILARLEKIRALNPTVYLFRKTIPPPPLLLAPARDDSHVISTTTPGIHPHAPADQKKTTETCLRIHPVFRRPASSAHVTKLLPRVNNAGEANLPAKQSPYSFPYPAHSSPGQGRRLGCSDTKAVVSRERGVIRR